MIRARRFHELQGRRRRRYAIINDVKKDLNWKDGVERALNSQLIGEEWQKDEPFGKERLGVRLSEAIPGAFLRRK